MAMNRFVGLGILALSAMAVSIAACDDSTAATDPVNTPVGTTPVGTTPVGTTPVGTTPVGTTPVGTTPVGTTPVGTTPVTPVTPTGACDATVDFVKIAAATEKLNWVDKTANGCGVSGSFYAYGDTNGTLTSPAPVAAVGGEYATPCTAAGCCISGTTTTFTDGGTVLTYKEWGAGLGFSLADPGAGAAKAAYVGAIKGFKFTITGTTVGQAVNVKVKHTAADSEMSALSAIQVVPGVWTVPFTSATCANYSYTEAKCDAATSGSATGVYDVQIQVSGGKTAGAFNVCLTSLVPTS